VSWLLAKEIPYALTFVVTALGWCLMRAVNAIQDSPSVSYSEKIIPRSGGGFDVTFHIKNISRNHLFRGISFYISTSDGTLSDANAKPRPPAKVVEDDNLAPQHQGEMQREQRVGIVRFYVAQLQPEASWDFCAVLSKTSTPQPHLLADFSTIGTNPGAKAEPASLRLIRDGPETYLVEHQVEILLLASFIWLIIAIVYICTVSSRSA
jgi:hypothetical protein